MYVSKTPCPPGVGTRSDIPDDILSIAHLQRDSVVAWVTLDDEFKSSIGRFTCCQTFGIFFFMPCFWPHMIILLPCLLASKLSTDCVIRNTYWILTTTEVKVVVKSYHGCCSTIGDRVGSIPLDAITNCGSSTQDISCGCCTTVPSIHIDTARNNHNHRSDDNTPRHAAVGYGLSGYDWLVTEILARRDAMKGHNHHHLPVPTAIHPGMDRGENRNSQGESIESRLQSVKSLHNLGMISEIEYEKKRKEIIASI